MRAGGRGRARRLARVRRPAGRRHAVAHAVRRRSTARPCSSPIACSTSSTTARRPGKPWFAHVSYLRPHPPFLAPAPYDTMFDPASVPAPVRAATPRRGRRAASVARPDDQPPVRRVARRPAGAARAAGDLLRDDGRGRRSARPRLRRARRDGPRVAHARGAHVGSRRDARRPLAHAQARLVRPDVPRAADRPRPARRFDATRGRVVDAFTEHVDVLPTIAELLDTEVPLQCDGRPLTPWLDGETPADWRNEVHSEFDFRDPDGAMFEGAFGLTLEECSLAVLRDDHGKYVHFSGHPTMPPIFFDLDADPAQIVNRAADPEYAAQGARLRAAHARLAHAPRRAHAHRHEAHRPQRSRRAPRTPEVAHARRRCFGFILISRYWTPR